MNFDSIIKYLESQKLFRSWQFIITWILLRNFLEAVLEKSQQISFSQFSYRTCLMFFVHFPLFYITLFLALVIFLKLISRVHLGKVCSIGSTGFGLIILVPIIDFIMHRGYLITYPLRLQNYFMHFFNPFVSLTDIGISPGQRIIIFSIILLIAIYTFFKSRSILRAVLSFFISAIIILLWGSLSTIIANNIPEQLYINGGFLFTDTQKFSSLYGLLLILLLIIYFYIYDSAMLGYIFDSLRIERMVFFGGMTIFGYIYARHLVPDYTMKAFDPVAVTILFVVFALVFWVVQIINDFYDLDADRVSRSRNPLLGHMTKQQYMVLGIVLILVTLSLAAIVSYTVFMLTMAFILLGFIYSVPLIRLKQVLVLATFTHALAVIITMAAGFSLFYGSRALHVIPGHLLIPFLISITLGFTAKDINDVQADRRTGIITLPVLFHYDNKMLGRLVMAFIIGFSYLIFGLFMPRLLPGALIFAVLSTSVMIIFKRVREIVYFILLYAFGFYLIVMLLLYY